MPKLRGYAVRTDLGMSGTEKLVGVVVLLWLCFLAWFMLTGG